MYYVPANSFAGGKSKTFLYTIRGKNSSATVKTRVKIKYLVRY